MGRVLDSVDHKVQIFIPFPVVSVPELPPPSKVAGSSGCYVVSDTYCKTRKYLVGLALGLPCVSYCWITECIEKVCEHFSAILFDCIHVTEV